MENNEDYNKPVFIVTVVFLILAAMAILATYVQGNLMKMQRASSSQASK